MPKVENSKLYLIDLRAEMMKRLLEKGYTITDIGVVFNVDKSIVSRILATHTSSK